MSPDPAKGYRALLRRRYSQAGLEYFITFCSEARQAGLTDATVASAFLTELQQMETEAIWRVRSAVTMPDHVHMLLALGEKLPLGKAVARLKSKTAARLAECGLSWQAGYFDHRMRSAEERLPIFLYLYLNPYRAGLVPAESDWPWFVCSSEDSWFRAYLGRLPLEPSWLADLP
jgi:putative transposase